MKRLITTLTGRASLFSTLAIVTVLNGWWVDAALAQRTVRPPEQSTPWASWACVLIFTGFVVAIACKNPRRTHLS